MIRKPKLWILSLGLLCLAGAGDSQVALRIGNDLTLSPGATASDNCTRLRSVLGAISDSAADNPYVVRLPAAVYDCGDPADPVAVPPWVALVGAGVGQTRILGSRDDEFSVGLVDLSAGSALRSLSVENQGDPTAFVVVGVSVIGADGTRLTDTSISAGEVGPESFSCGLFVEDGSILVQGSALFGETDVATVDNGAGTGELLVAGSRLEVGDASERVVGTGVWKCVSSYDENLDPLGSNCETPPP